MTVLVCFTFLLNALVEKATRTFDQRERIELGSPERCRTNLRDILETASSNSQAFVAVTSPFGPRAYMATLPMCTCLLYRGSVFMATRTTLLIICVKCQEFWKFKIYLWRAPWRVMWSLTTMSQIDPVSGSPLMKRPLQLFHEVQYVWNMFVRQTWQDQCTLLGHPHWRTPISPPGMKKVKSRKQTTEDGGAYNFKSAMYLNHQQWRVWKKNNAELRHNPHDVWLAV